MEGFFSLPQTRELLQYSEDEDAVVIRSLDFCSDYIDDCQWASVQQHKPQRVRGQLDGSTDRDTVCGAASVYKKSSFRGKTK